MATEIKGIIKVIGEFQTFESGFTKQQIVVTEEGQYPNDLAIDFLKDKADYLQNFKVGDNVNVSVNIKGSEYQGKYYVGLNGWKITANNPQSGTTNPSENNAQTQTNPKEIPNSSNTEEFSDLPF